MNFTTQSNYVDSPDPENAVSLADINAKISEIEVQRALLQEQQDAYLQSEKNDVIAKIIQKIEEYKITVSDLGLKQSSKQNKKLPGFKGETRFKGPNGELWSGGRGRKPLWVMNALQAGHKISEFSIN